MRSCLPRWFAVVGLVAACGGPSRPGGDDAPDASPAPRDYHRGLIHVSEQRQNAQTLGNLFVALPQDQLFDGPDASAGGCDYFTRDEIRLSAGRIVVNGTLTPLSATPDSSTPPVHYTVSGNGTSDLWADGATLPISADGDPLGLPAFGGTVQTPPAIIGATFPDAVLRSAPPTITWTAGTADEMWLWALVPLLGNGIAILWCYPANDGSYTFPQDAFDLLDPGAGSIVIELWASNKTTVMAGTFPVDLVASDAVTTVMIGLDP